LNSLESAEVNMEKAQKSLDDLEKAYSKERSDSSADSAETPVSGWFRSM